MISIKKVTAEKLKNLKITRLETYDEIISRLNEAFDNKDEND